MREIPAEVRELLKSKSMIGENKPSYEVTVEGLGGGFNWDISTAWYQPSTTIAGDLTVAKKANGKLICVITQQGTFYEGECDNVELLLSQDDSAINWQQIPITASGYCAVSRVDDKLFINVTEIGNVSGLPGSSKLYISPSGNGGDWEYYSTVSSQNRTDLNESISVNLNSAGCITKLSTGKWVFITALFKNYQYADLYHQQFGYAESSDDGVTWICSGLPSGVIFIGDSYGQGGPKHVVEINGKTYFAFFGAHTFNLGLNIYEGSVWKFGINLDSIVAAGNTDAEFIFNGKNGVYMYCNRSNLCHILEIEDINNPAPVLLASYERPNENVGTNPSMQIIDNKLVITQENYVMGIDVSQKRMPVKSINISRNKNMAGSLNLAIDNKNGAWSPDNTINQNALFPNKEITVRQGYGAELVQTFSGLIDRIEMTTFPQSINLSVRDKLKLALDQIITPNVIAYTAQTVEAIFTDLAVKAGLTTGTVETTGLTIAEKTFSWETYADCFSWLAYLVGYDFGCDEDGKAYFKKDAIPAATDWILTFTDGKAQAYAPIVENSDTLKSSDGLTIYVRDTDYTINYETGELTSITIDDEETLLSYVFAVYSFKEGEDIISLGYTIDDNDIYSKVIVYGKDENDEVISAYKDYVSKDYYNVLLGKIMKIDVSEVSTVEQLQAIADRAEMLMRSRVRTVRFAAVAVPWLQVGDLIQVVENSTTISELYRVTDLSTNMDSNGYTMQITCYHHSA